MGSASTVDQLQHLARWPHQPDADPAQLSACGEAGTAEFGERERLSSRVVGHDAASSRRGRGRGSCGGGVVV